MTRHKLLPFTNHDSWDSLFGIVWVLRGKNIYFQRHTLFLPQQCLNMMENLIYACDIFGNEAMLFCPN